MDFYFYSSGSTNWNFRVKGAMEKFPEYEFESGVQVDEDWDTYLSYLFPSEFELQTINDHRVLRSLESSGDALTEAREITHWAYFPHDLARQAFETKITSLGFVVDSLREPDDEQCLYGIVISREDTPSYEEIGDVTLSLYQLAVECGGEYDGWETGVVT